MLKQIKARRKKGWKPTKKQAEFIKDILGPQYCTECGYCAFNLDLYLGIVKVGGK